MDSSKEHIPRLERFLDEINYRHTVLPPPCPEFLKTHHHWIHHILGPRTSWTTVMLTRLEKLSSTFCERLYSYADAEMKFLLARLTAIGIYLDDSIDDSKTYDDIEDFMRRVYMGEAQKTGTVLSLFHECIKELCGAYEGDAMLRDLAIASWLAFADACLLERRLLAFDEEVRASPHDMGYEQILERRKATSGTVVEPETIPDEAEINFPLFLRIRSGVGEAFAAAIFKAFKNQRLPLTRFVKALPDIVYYIDVTNDLLSFYKEQLAGETVNMISLQHKSWKRLRRPTGPTSEGEWSIQDTFGRLCDETRDAILRVDKLLRMEVCEKIEKGEVKCADVGLEIEDVTIARQWREFRHGYISWQVEFPRYKLDFMSLTRYE